MALKSVARRPGRSAWIAFSSFASLSSSAVSGRFTTRNGEPTLPLGPGTPAGSVAGRLAAAVATAARTGEPARVGRLEGYRDFVDVRDVAAAVLAAATAPELPPPLLNVGSGRATAVRTLAAAIVARSGGPGVLESGALPAETATRQRADLTATVAALGWRPTVGLGASVRDMLRQAVAV